MMKEARHPKDETPGVAEAGLQTSSFNIHHSPFLKSVGRPNAKEVARGSHEETIGRPTMEE
jgi:hypothetical protein